MATRPTRSREHRSLIIAGAGGHGRVCADVARRCGWQVAGFVDRCHPCGTEVSGAPILANDETRLFAAWPEDASLFVALGDNARRLAIVREAARLRIDVAVLVDPSAIVSPSASLAPGVVVMPGAVINAEAHVGTGVIVNTSAIVEHGVNLGEGAHVAPGACLTGDAAAGAQALIGAHATVLPGVTVGPHAVVGAGAVVAADVPGHTTVAGVPARTLHAPAPKLAVQRSD